VGKAKIMDATRSGEKDDAEASHVPEPGSIVPGIVNQREREARLD
jgi:hypothetical protein